MNKIKKFENYSNSISDLYPEHRSQKSIFVSLVSYRDENIENTVKSMLLNAKRPENIYISVVISSIGNHEQWSQFIEDRLGTITNVTLKKFESGDKHNIGELRNIADAAYNREDFYMIVDSSSEFDPYWDDILIKQYTSICSIAQNDDIVLTADPRAFLPHDNPRDGFVFFTNHKTRSSFQREKYDGARIPISGYSPFLTGADIALKDIDSGDMESPSHYAKNLDFLNKYGFPKFSNRRFFKDEVLAPALGISSKFIFSNAKNYLRTNKIEDFVISDEDFDFISLINLIDSQFVIISPRWLPIYHEYDEEIEFLAKRKSPKDFYEEDILNSKSYIYIQSIIDKIQNDDNYDKRNHLNDILSIDWEERSFKIRDKHIRDVVCEFANLFVNSYNFSTNENSLHWNKRDI